ncbi:hypothetical protein GCM10020331_020720 [Ectobacillus funiculus]
MEKKIKPWNGDDTIVYTATNVIRYIYTGGFAGAALGEIHDYLFKAGHNFDVKRATDGSLVFPDRPIRYRTEELCRVQSIFR